MNAPKKKLSIVESIVGKPKDVILKSGKRLNELSKPEIIDVLVNHNLPEHPDYNPGHETAVAAAIAVKDIHIRQSDQIRAIRGLGVKENQRKAAKFPVAVKNYVGEAKGKTTTQIAAEIEQLIGMDSNEIEQAKNRGEEWQKLDLRFPARKNAHGDPYSARAIRDEVRAARRK